MTRKARQHAWAMVMLAAMLGTAQISWAQYMGGLAPPEALDTVSGMSTGGGGAGQVALDRARNLPQPGMAGMPGMSGMPGMAPFPGMYFPQPQNVAVPEQVEPVIPKISVLLGERVRDAVTKELLDEPLEIKVPETEKGNYYDDGTHGDVMANDGKYALVDSMDNVLGEGSQRAKEQVVKALVVAEDLTPLEFYGFSIMSTELRQAQPRDRAWELVPDPNGGPGYVLDEVKAERPVQVPNYREWRSARDAKVKDDWSSRFLRNYRVNPDDITSEFYRLHIPRPPQIPEVRPPVAEGWTPFSDPQALSRAEMGEPATGGGAAGFGAYPGGAYPGGGVTGAPMGAASSRYY